MEYPRAEDHSRLDTGNVRDARRAQAFSARTLSDKDRERCSRSIDRRWVGASSCAFYRLRDDGILPVICPTSQIFSTGCAHACDRRIDLPATVHGVVFDIWVRKPWWPFAAVPTFVRRVHWRPAFRACLSAHSDAGPRRWTLWCISSANSRSAFAAGPLRAYPAELDPETREPVVRGDQARTRDWITIRLSGA